MERQALKKLLGEAHVGDAHRVEEALRDAAWRTLTAEEAVVASGAVSEQTLCELMARHFGLPLVSLRGTSLDAAVVRLISYEAARNYCVIPYRLEGDVLTLAMADPEDGVAEDVVRFMSRRTTERVMAPRSEILEAIDRCYAVPAVDPALERLLEKLPLAEDVQVLNAPQRERSEEAAESLESAPIVRMLNSIVLEAARMHASDIHVEPQKSTLRVRYRVDGLLQPMTDLPKNLQWAFNQRVKSIAGLDVQEKRRPQEGRACLTMPEGHADLRVNTLPTLYGEKVVIRLLDNMRPRVDIDLPGLLPADREKFAHVINLSQGLVVCTGPAGCGKTSTLYSALGRRNADVDNIVTIEDPVECELAGVTQIPVRAEAGLGFAEALQSVLSQDPNVVMVGELSDERTSGLALEAAHDGRLVLCALKARDAVSAVSRLSHLALPSHLVATSLACVVGQRLVRHLCPHCRVEAPASAHAVLSLNYLSEALPSRTFESRGCGACNYTGYKGRLGIFEILVMTDRLRDIVAAGASGRELLTAARQEGMTTMLEDGLKKVSLGWTTIEEVLRVAASEGSAGRRCVHCGRVLEESFSVCPYCSEGLTQRCPSCARGVENEWVTCPYCRFSLSDEDDRADRSSLAEASPRLNVVSILPTLGDAGGDGAAVRARDTILLVDDEEISAEVVKSMLEEQGGYQVVVAGNGEEGLQMAIALRPSLILSDIIMPQMDGFELVRALRGQLRTALIPVILMTSRTDGELSAFEAGADDYLRKPIEVDRLLARVGAVLRRCAVRL